MDNDLVSIVTVAISMVSLILSTRVSISQYQSQKYANYVPVISTLYDAFRSREFHQKFRLICEDLEGQDPALGISGLSREAQDAVYDVAYLFQSFALMSRIGVMNDERIHTALLKYRVVSVWDAIAEFVRTERKKPGGSPTMLKYLEDFAARLRAAPEDHGLARRGRSKVARRAETEALRRAR